MSDEALEQALSEWWDRKDPEQTQREAEAFGDGWRARDQEVEELRAEVKRFRKLLSRCVCVACYD